MRKQHTMANQGDKVLCASLNIFQIIGSLVRMLTRENDGDKMLIVDTIDVKAVCIFCPLALKNKHHKFSQCVSYFLNA